VDCSLAALTSFGVHLVLLINKSRNATPIIARHGLFAKSLLGRVRLITTLIFVVGSLETWIASRPGVSSAVEML
jgi:hypothetical protein